MDHGGPEQPPFAPDGYWRRLVEQINEWPGTAIVSMEFLAPRQRPKIDIIKEAFADSDIQVVLTARDLARSLPAMWTESMQNRGVKTWEEFLEAVRHEERREGRPVVLAQPAHLRDRRALVRGGRPRPLHPGHGAAQGRAARRCSGTGSPRVAGIPEGLCDIDVRSNPGIDAASAMVLRALNERLEADGFNRQDYERVVKGVLAKQGFVRRGRESVPLGLDERWVRRRSKR